MYQHYTLYPALSSLYLLLFSVSPIVMGHLCQIDTFRQAPSRWRFKSRNGGAWVFSSAALTMEQNHSGLRRFFAWQPVIYVQWSLDVHYLLPILEKTIIMF